MRINLNNYTEWLEERNRSPRTIFTYCQALKQFWQDKEISTESIRTFLKTNLNKYQPNSLRVFRQALSSYSKFQKINIDWNWITGIIPKSMKRLFSTLSLEELEQLKALNQKKAKWLINAITSFLIFFSLVV